MQATVDKERRRLHVGLGQGGYDSVQRGVCCEENCCLTIMNSSFDGNGWLQRLRPKSVFLAVSHPSLFS